MKTVGFLVFFAIFTLSYGLSISTTPGSDPFVQYMIDLPPNLIERMSDPNSVVSEFWHPKLPATRFVTKEATKNDHHQQSLDQDGFPSFLALQERTIPVDNETLKFVTNDGSDAQSKLEANGKKMSCECRFVRDYSGEDSYNIDSVDDLLGGGGGHHASNPKAGVSSELLQEKQILTNKRSELPPVTADAVLFGDSKKVKVEDLIAKETPKEDTADNEQYYSLLKALSKKVDQHSDERKRSSSQEDDHKKESLVVSDDQGYHDDDRSRRDEDDYSSSTDDDEVDTELLTQLITTLGGKGDTKHRDAPERKRTAAIDEGFDRFLQMYDAFEKFEKVQKEEEESRTPKKNDKFKALLQMADIEGDSLSSNYHDSYFQDTDPSGQLIELLSEKLGKIQSEKDQVLQQQQQNAKTRRLKKAISSLLDK